MDTAVGVKTDDLTLSRDLDSCSSHGDSGRSQCHNWSRVCAGPPSCGVVCSGRLRGIRRQQYIGIAGAGLVDTPLAGFSMAVFTERSATDPEWYDVIRCFTKSRISPVAGKASEDCHLLCVLRKVNALDHISHEILTYGMVHQECQVEGSWANHQGVAFIESEQGSVLLRMR